jgi:hypothetical protein
MHALHIPSRTFTPLGRHTLVPSNRLQAAPILCCNGLQCGAMVPKRVTGPCPDLFNHCKAAGLTFAGVQLEVVGSFRYLGITFAAGQPLTAAAAQARTRAARAAMGACNQRYAALGVVAEGVRLRLFSTMVDSVLSHGAEVWAVQLVTAAVAGSGQGSL